jgi:hypothetical protein
VAIKVTALIKRVSSIDPRTRNKCFRAALSLQSEDGKEYATPRYFGGFEDVAKLLKREAGATHVQLQDRYPRYQKGEEVRLSLTLDDDEVIRNLGFNPKEM